MTDRSNEPLTVMEQRVFGVDAKRRADGSIIQQGSMHDPYVAAIRAEEDRRAAEAVKSAREIHLRTVHPYPEKMQ